MSQIETPDLVIEWSPEEVRAYWPRTGTSKTGKTIVDAVSGQTSGKALILISRRASFVRATRLPNVGGRDLQMLIKNTLPGLIPLPSAELAYDAVQTGDINNEGRLVVLGAVLNPYLVRLNAEAKAAGVSIGATIPAGFTAPTIAQKIGLRDAAVVEESAGGLNIDLVSGGILRYSRLAMPAGDVESEVARTYAAAGLTPGSVISVGTSNMDAPYSTQTSSLKTASELDLKHLPMNLELSSVVDDRLNQAIQKRRQYSVLFLVASIAVAAMVYMDRTANQDQYNKKMSAAQIAVDDAQRKLDLANKEIQSVLPTTQTVGRGFKPAQPLVDVLSVITNDVPSNVWLTAVSLERGKSFTIRGSSVSSEAVTLFLQNLGAEDRLRDVTLQNATTSTIQQVQVIQFNIQGFPVGNLPLVDDKKSTSSSSSSSSSSTGSTGSTATSGTAKGGA